MKEYILSLQYSPDIEHEYNGNFSVTKEYIVRHPSARKQIRGIVVQYVQKSSSVTDARGHTYNTTKSIQTFTNEQVQYSNDSYFEIFDVYTNGHSKNADAFQNNALTSYDMDDGELVPNTYEPSDPLLYHTYKTHGEIHVAGTNCFISTTNPAYNRIMKLPWTKHTDTPANGLPYLPYSKQHHALIFNSCDSNKLTHTVHVTWTFSNPISNVTSTYHTSHTMDGGYIKSKHKHMRTKRTHTLKFLRPKYNSNKTLGTYSRKRIKLR